MNIPYFLYKHLPLFDYVCPACRKEVKKTSHKCIHCGERYGVPVHVPPYALKELLKGNPKPAEEYVHKHIFPRLSAFERDYLTKYFTVIFSSGWENSGGSDITDGGAWTGTSGTPVVVADPVHHGSYAIQCNADSEFCYKTITADNELFGRLYFQLSDFPDNSGETQVFMQFRTSATVLCQVGFGFDTAVKWRFMYRSDGSLATVLSQMKTDAIAANEWICVEMRILCSTADGNLDGEYQVWVNGVELTDIAQTGIDTDYTSMDRIYVGTWGADVAAGVTEDCVVLADAYIGPEEAPPAAYRPRRRMLMGIGS